MISPSAHILFLLLRSALGKQPVEGLPADINWKSLIDLSFDQGVAAIALDGLQKLYEANPGLELELDKEELEDQKYEWFGVALQAEKAYRMTTNAVQSLGKEFPIVVLKGLAIARKYPVPEHRESVDLDVYFNENENRMLMGVDLIRDDYKHTGFMYQGVMVEYHKSLTAWKSLKNGRYIEKTLQKALGTPERIYASDYFNALFVAVHSYTHFMLEDGISLKHLIDWQLMVESLGLKVEGVMKTLETFGMREFAESMTRVSNYVCKDPSTELTAIDQKMLEDILALGHKRRFKNGHLNMAYNILICNGWKFRAFAKESDIACLFRCAWNAISK